MMRIDSRRVALGTARRRLGRFFRAFVRLTTRLHARVCVITREHRIIKRQS